ncbi:hypothetical protein GLOTRDRAFT_140228 [Gloeophyllum trabeum ATCC 11539]|uniref:Pre-mRNA-splicing factor CWC2 n=1 Tax=Gloeophyllum trabeum (strain ATCC 11539 / FP-39264 / Madison 617) TaxID=670483 RepID=S7PY09_GLOTA|nr:uncharacterized protein GLOTRDRAFT_140228 [Gloeophyllum trabeum ATCC 11539]EPQ52501.1 hypothetical protein GLOTRDRAFT_140228 [Gloeophyllum trabeum ATCC 11539]
MSTETAVTISEPHAVVNTTKKQKKLKPARKQVKPGEVEKKEAPQTGQVYNIWYNKWAGGDREDNYSNKTKSQTRCNIRKDAGLTRANTTGMKYYCLFFARGCCPYGWECEYLHMLPDESTELPDNSKDVFARDKFADYRDDMGGVGSFQRQNRTLYIGRIKETGTGPETEEVVKRHFKEWGEIEKIRVLQYRSVAFVTYVSELNAQFAKEAMACQSLDNDEILNVRWATEDPNPTSKVAEKRRLEEIGQKAIQEKMDPRIVDAMRAMRALEDGDVLDETEEGDDGPDTKRRRLEIEDGRGESEEPDYENEAEELLREEAEQKKAGLLSTDTLESLKYFAEIQKQTGVARLAAVKPPPAPAPAALGLADYASDDE